METLGTILFIMIGGTLGALTRFFIQEGARLGTKLPGWGAILIANVFGSMVIGFGYAWMTGHLELVEHESIHGVSRFMSIEEWNAGMAFMLTGYCGGLTTFSTFSLDNVFLFKLNPRQLAFNVIGSVGFGFLGAWVGILIGRMTF